MLGVGCWCLWVGDSSFLVWVCIICCLVSLVFLVVWFWCNAGFLANLDFVVLGDAGECNFWVGCGLIWYFGFVLLGFDLGWGFGVRCLVVLSMAGFRGWVFVDVVADLWVWGVCVGVLVLVDLWCV